MLIDLGADMKLDEKRISEQCKSSSDARLCGPGLCYADLLVPSALAYEVRASEISLMQWLLKKLCAPIASGRLQNYFLRWSIDEGLESCYNLSFFHELLAVIISEKKDVLLTGEARNMCAALSKAKQRFSEIEVEDGYKLLQVFQAQGLEPLVHYTQHYKLYYYQGMYIHLDTVPQLGTFIKFSFPSEEVTLEEIAERSKEIRVLLKLGEDSACTANYMVKLFT